MSGIQTDANVEDLTWPIGYQKSLRQTFAPRIEALKTAFGQDVVEQQFETFSQNFFLVSKMNKELVESGLAEGPEYTALMQKIVEATDKYYSHVSALHPELRSFFLLLTSMTTEDLALLSEMMPVELLSETKNTLSLRNVRPNKYVMQIDAITNQLAKLGGSSSVKVGTKANAPIKTLVTLDMPDHMKIDGGALSTYDKSIINGVTSLLESGNMFFSIPMLYHAMTGKQNPTVDEQLTFEVAGRLEKMRRMTLAIDLSQEVASRQIRDESGELMELSNLEIEGYLLPLNKISGNINGRRTELYQILHEPPLYTYSKIKRQLASVPLQMLDAPVNNNLTTIPLKTYLIQRVEMMKNPRNSIRSTRILYDSVYEELGAEDANKTRKMRIRSYTTTILEYFIMQGYIKGYSEFKKGRSIGGVQIVLN